MTELSHQSASANSSPGDTLRASLTRRWVTCLLVLPAVMCLVWLWGRPILYQRQLSSLLEAGRIAEAREMAVAHSGKSGTAEMSLLIVQTLRMAGDPDEADRLLLRYESTIDSAAQVSQQRTLNRARRGQLSGGIDGRLAALLRDPRLDERDVCEAYAVGFRLNRRFSEAAQLLDAWRRDWPDDHRPWHHEGLMHQTLTRWQQAIDSYTEALQRQPDAAATRLRMGECLNQLARGQEAIVQFEWVTSRQPDNAAGWEGLANALRQTGDYASARSAYLRVLALMPENFAARRAIAEIDLDTDDPESAVAIATDLLQIWPEDVATLYVLSRAEAQLGRGDRSRQLVERWTQADKAVQDIESDIQVLAERVSDMELQVSLGERMLRHYSREMGIQFITMALQINPTDERAAQALRDFQKRSQKIAALPVPGERSLP
ncbi:MAG: tetratricopeptide repeat protein [Planctomycetaceae bacterium]|nr:tetratricopeptide repeat protein [Planctomycetaceae bacterium]